MSKKTYDDDDGRVIADMSGLERQPLLMPDASAIKKVKEQKSETNEPGNNDAAGPEVLDKEGRRAMMRGVMSAYFLVGGIIFAAFAAVILILGHLH